MEKIAVDAMGGDFAPLEIVLGSIQAVREFKIPVVLVGDKEQILTILKNNHEENNPLMRLRSLKWENIPDWLIVRRRMHLYQSEPVL